MDKRCKEVLHTRVAIFIALHSQFMAKRQVGHGDKSWSNLGRLRIDQDFTR